MTELKPTHATEANDGKDNPHERRTPFRRGPRITDRKEKQTISFSFVGVFAIYRIRALHSIDGTSQPEDAAPGFDAGLYKDQDRWWPKKSFLDGSALLRWVFVCFTDDLLWQIIFSIASAADQRHQGEQETIIVF